MWLLFHRNAKTRVVRDGRSFIEVCPECERQARFVEVEVEENYGVFFIDVISDKERKYRCTACGDIFDLRDKVDVPPAKSAKQLAEERVLSAKQLAEERALSAKQLAEERILSAKRLAHERALAEARQTDETEQRRARAEVRSIRIEDELAELKKRLGR